MPTCNAVRDFLNQVNNRSVTTPLATADTQHLVELGLVESVTGSQYAQLVADVQTLAAAQAALAQEAQDRVRLAGTLRDDFARTHSVLFHLHGEETRSSETAAEAKDRAALQSLEADLEAKQRAFSELVAKRSLLDTLTPAGDLYVGLTSVGQLQLRDLGVRLYRVGDAPFDAYWAEAQRIGSRMDALADAAAGYYVRLAPGLPSLERSGVWGAALGLPKTVPDPTLGAARFVSAFDALAKLSGNDENRLMASEIVFALPRPVPDQVPDLTELVRDVRKLRVPNESALGVGAILLFGRRGDGTFATGNLPYFLGQTKSYESASLMAILNTPADALAQKFQSLRGMFAAWGYTDSEDVELSAAYLAVSELPVDGMSTKLSIIAKGMGAYLEYPLVAASVLASVSTLEANETLNLLEHAYTVIGRRATGLSQAELICLAVRMVEGIRTELVGALDATAAAAPAAARPAPLFVARPFFVPFVVMHGAYFATYSGFSGAHPAHAHGFAGGGMGG